MIFKFRDAKPDMNTRNIVLVDEAHHRTQEELYDRWGGFTQCFFHSGWQSQ
jgi:hypothetical protein